MRVTDSKEMKSMMLILFKWIFEVFVIVLPLVASFIFQGVDLLGAQSKQRDFWDEVVGKSYMPLLESQPMQILELDDNLSIPVRNELILRARFGLPIRRSEIKRFVRKIQSSERESFATYYAIPEFFFSPSSDFQDIRDNLGEFQEVMEIAIRELTFILLEDESALRDFTQLYLWTQNTKFQGYDLRFRKGQIETQAVEVIAFEVYMHEINKFNAFVEESWVFREPDFAGSFKFWWSVRQLILYISVSGEHQHFDKLLHAIQQTEKDHKNVELIGAIYRNWYQKMSESPKSFISRKGETHFKYSPFAANILAISQLVHWMPLWIAKNLQAGTLMERAKKLFQTGPFLVLQDVYSPLPRPILDYPKDPIVGLELNYFSKKIGNHFVVFGELSGLDLSRYRSVRIVD